MKWSRWLLALALVFLSLNSAQAALYRDTATGGIYTSSAPGREEFKPFGIDLAFQLFLDYRYELANPNATPRTTQPLTRPMNAFESQRSIIDFKKSFSKTVRARLILDNRGDVNAYALYVRHVYGEVDWSKMDLTFSFGEIPNPISPSIDGCWGYRVQGTNMVEREGLTTSGDWGVGLLWKPKWAPLEWNTTFVNGQGRTTQELNAGKMVESRLVIKIPQVTGLQFGGSYSYTTGGNTINSVGVNGADSNTQVMTAGAYLIKPSWRIGGEYVWSRHRANTYAMARQLVANGTTYPTINMDRSSLAAAGFTNTSISGNGFTVFGTVKIPRTKFVLIGRYDFYDPFKVAKVGHHRWIAGPSYEFSDNMRFLINWESLKYKNQAIVNGAGAVYNNSRVMAMTEIKF